MLKSHHYLVAVLLIFLCCCSSSEKTKSAAFLIPENYEGAVVIFLDQENGVAAVLEEGSYIFNIPNDGVLRIKASTLSEKPDFFLVGGNGQRRKLEYLQNKVGSGEGRNFNEISNEEKENKVFAMNYEQGNFNASNGIVRYKSFLICKPKDGNLFASRDLNNKISDFHKTTYP